MYFIDDCDPQHDKVDYGNITAARRRFDELHATFRGKPTKRNERLYIDELGTLSLDEAVKRQELAALLKDVHLAWRLNFWTTVDARDATDGLIGELGDRICVMPKMPFYPTPYIRFADHPNLKFASGDGLVHGALVRPFRAPNGETRCMEEAKSNSKDEFADVATGFQIFVFATLMQPCYLNTLESWVMHYSQFVSTAFVSGQFHLVDGDPNLIGDPAVDLANRLALKVFAENLAELNCDGPLERRAIHVTL